MSVCVRTKASCPGRTVLFWWQCSYSTNTSTADCERPGSGCTCRKYPCSKSSPWQVITLQLDSRSCALPCKHWTTYIIYAARLLLGLHHVLIPPTRHMYGSAACMPSKAGRPCLMYRYAYAAWQQANRPEGATKHQQARSPQPTTARPCGCTLPQRKTSTGVNAAHQSLIYTASHINHTRSRQQRSDRHAGFCTGLQLCAYLCVRRGGMDAAWATMVSGMHRCGR